MSLTLAVNNALTGLNVNQQSLAVLSQNIANANTAGYSRQIINQQAIYLDGVGEGVSIESITRKIDEYLTRAVQGQNSSVGYANALNDFYTRIQLLLGTPGQQDSIDSYINGFFNSLQSLSQSPDNTTIQRIAVNSGVTLATQIQKLAVELQNLQFQADTEIGQGVNTVNTKLNRLFELNQIIAENKALGRSVADLEDQRDVLVNDVASFLDVSTFLKSDGKLFLTTAGGISILDDSRYQLEFSQVSSPDAFKNDATLSALKVTPVDAAGNSIGPSTTLATEGTSSQITTLLTNGKIKALYDLRDEILPGILEQMDTMAANLRDQVNAIHNAGSGYPGSNTYTGTRLVFGQDYSDWTGSVRISVLDQNGVPIAAPYNDEPNGLQALTLNLGTLNTGSGAGTPTVQGIIDAINQFYGIPQNKAKVGNLNNIQLVSDTTALPAASNLFSFDFNINNISSNSSSFFVTGLQVTDDTAVDITSVTQNVPTVALNPLATYVTTAGSNVVTINTTAPHNFGNGDSVYLSLPSGPVDGIAAADLSGIFTISNVTSNSFQINVATNALAGGTFAEAGMTATPPYAQADPGENARGADNGLITVDLSGNPAAVYYNITATVAVRDENGTVSTSQITYRINNQQNALYGRYFGANSLANGGTLVLPNTNFPIATAKLVDADGKEIPKVNGQYVSTDAGYLQLKGQLSTYMLAIDSLDSKELGKLATSPAQPGTNRGFSHYFDLNDFFISNSPTSTGDTLRNSAINMQVEDRIKNNSSLISRGTLAKSLDPVDPTKPPNFTYRLYPSDNSVIANLSGLAAQALTFTAAGGLGVTTQTLSGYTGQIVGSISVNSANAKTNSGNADALLQGYTVRVSAISGVNLDVELANTVIYQNAYAASARVITVANTLFEALLQAF